MNNTNEKRKVVAALGVLLLFLCAVNVKAQTDNVQTEAIEQVAFDVHGRFFTLDSAMQAKTKTFQTVLNLYEARLFLLPDSSYMVYLTVKKENRLVTEQKPLTASDVHEIRTAVQRELDAEPALLPVVTQVGPDQSGRTALLVGSTVWSLFYYGTATNFALNYSDAEPLSFNAFTYLFAGGIGFLVPAILTANAPVSQGAASLALGGMFQGTLHGWGLALLIQGNGVNNPRFGFGLSVLTGVGETVAGYLMGTKYNISEGDAGVINTTSFYGMLSGALLSALIVKEFDTDGEARLAGGLGLLGGGAGLLLGNSIRGTQNFTSSDASIYATSGLFGLALPYVILSAINPNELDIRTVTGIGIAGVAAGLFAGLELVRGKDYGGSAGTTTILSAIAGGLVGIGTADLLKLGASTTPLVTYLCAASGFAISLATISAGREATTSRSGLLFDVNPLAPLLASTFRGNYSVPFVSARWKF